jgi:hypothetical protein
MERDRECALDEPVGGGRGQAVEGLPNVGLGLRSPRSPQLDKIPLEIGAACRATSRVDALPTGRLFIPGPQKRGIATPTNTNHSLGTPHRGHPQLDGTHLRSWLHPRSPNARDRGHPQLDGTHLRSWLHPRSPNARDRGHPQLDGTHLRSWLHPRSPNARYRHPAPGAPST